MTRLTILPNPPVTLRCNFTQTAPMLDPQPPYKASDRHSHRKARDLSASLALVGPVLDEWNKAQKRFAEENRREGTGYNPLLELKISETAHSRILGDLLDPHGTHGQGDLFLMPFLRKLEVPEPECGDWRVSVEKIGRVDILIWRENSEGAVSSAVIIENKSNGAIDQPHQIYRYWHNEIFLWDKDLWKKREDASTCVRESRFHLVYLLEDGNKAPEAHSLQRPSEWDSAVNPFKEAPLKCVNLLLSELIDLWDKEAVSKIPESNHRLLAFFSLYREKWITS